jgi:prolyl oligopeptidase
MKASIQLLGAACAAAISLAYASGSSDPLAPVGGPPQPPPPPVRPVTENLYGTKVTDNYRYMEKLGPETLDWMKTQGAHTRKTLDAITPLAALKQRVAAFSGSFGFIQGYVSGGGRQFYEELTAGSDNFDLIVKDEKGKRKLVDLAVIRAAHGGELYSINYFLAAPDGSKVAVGISEGGSEDAQLFVYDATTGKQIAGPIERAEYGACAWSADSKLLYFIQLKKVAKADEIDKYKNPTVEVWDLKSPQHTVAGSGIGKNTEFLPDEAPAISISADSNLALLISRNGTQNELRVWTAPAASTSGPDAPWKLFFDRDAGITHVAIRGDDAYLVSRKNAPTSRVLQVKAGASLATATVLVPALADRVIEDVRAASDGIYVLARRGVYSTLLRVPTGSTRIEEISLPAKGHIAEAFADPSKPGININFSSWVLPPQEYAYDPATGKFADLGLEVRGDVDPAKFTVSDHEAKALDGTMIPLTIIQPVGTSKPQMTLVEAYGSYGYSLVAEFSAPRVAVMNEGITYAICHVRGGGELGDDWRLGGKDANKHNTWQDDIACGEELIARGITTRDKLFITGGSAGGITVGRAMSERPDLFAGVIDVVPAANTLRMEFSPNGPPNTPEFGSVATEQGFRNLYAMDSAQHVKKGVHYPAVMISLGLNDPRVEPWGPAKFAAALMASGSSNPVLLRVDANAGHGVGSSRTQGDLLTADWIAFIKWRAGVAGWRPEFGAHAAEIWQTLPKPPAMPRPRESGLAPVNGIRMYYAVYGEGPPVLLIHGGLGNADIWGFQVPALAKDHTVIVADSRGHGRSTRSNRPFSYALMADDYLALLDFLKIDKVALVGWSDGGIIGIDIAIRHPERLSRLFAFAANYTPEGGNDVANSPTFNAYIARAREDYMALSPTPDGFDAFLKEISKMWAVEPRYSKDQLRSITVPTTVFDGNHDEAIKPEHTREIAALIPGASLVIMKDASHFAMWQRPTEFNAIVRQFLAEK